MFIDDSKIKAVELTDNFSFYTDMTGNRLTNVEKIAHINILVGANNSGKSRFIRLLSFEKEVSYLISAPNISDNRDSLIKICKRISNLFSIFDYVSIKYSNNNHSFDINHIVNLNNFPSLLKFSSDLYLDIRRIFGFFSALDRSDALLQNSSGVFFKPHDQLIHDVKPLVDSGLQFLEKIPDLSKISDFKRVYIPILRGLRPLDEFHSDFFGNRTRTDYFPGEDKQAHPDVFTGLTLYNRLVEMLLGDNNERKLIQSYQDFVSKNLFQGQPIALIPHQKEKVVVVKIGNEKERPIHHLGDGLQNIIILSYLPFVTREPSLFFIEEPEIHLHPGLQRKLIEFFASQKNHTFFLTTHSNHLLDMTLDIKDMSVFTFRKVLPADQTDDEHLATFKVEQVDAAHMSTLELLGVRNSSVFLVNATIWVEGITDRWYLRKMLSLYMDKLAEAKQPFLRIEEDVHFSVVEYGGANITHWSFLDMEEHPVEVDRLCSRAIVIIDQDGNTKNERKQALADKLGDRLVMLPCREIENSLPYSVIRSIVADYEEVAADTLPPYENSDYKDKYLGAFVEQSILKGLSKRKGGYKSQSGTIKSKVDFCERAITKLDSFDALPKTTQEFVIKIYDFVVAQNTH